MAILVAPTISIIGGKKRRKILEKVRQAAEGRQFYTVPACPDGILEFARWVALSDSNTAEANSTRSPVVIGYNLKIVFTSV